MDLFRLDPILSSPQRQLGFGPSEFMRLESDLMKHWTTTFRYYHPPFLSLFLQGAIRINRRLINLSQMSKWLYLKLQYNSSEQRETGPSPRNKPSSLEDIFGLATRRIII